VGMGTCTSIYTLSGRDKDKTKIWYQLGN